MSRDSRVAGPALILKTPPPRTAQRGGSIKKDQRMLTQFPPRAVTVPSRFIDGAMEKLQSDEFQMLVYLDGHSATSEGCTQYQSEIADSLGLTTRRVERILQKLRGRGWITSQGTHGQPKTYRVHWAPFEPTCIEMPPYGDTPYWAAHPYELAEHISYGSTFSGGLSFFRHTKYDFLTKGDFDFLRLALRAAPGSREALAGYWAYQMALRGTFVHPEVVLQQIFRWAEPIESLFKCLKTLNEHRAAIESFGKSSKPEWKGIDETSLFSVKRLGILLSIADYFEAQALATATANLTKSSH
jgi:hypothetical protein